MTSEARKPTEQAGWVLENTELYELLSVTGVLGYIFAADRLESSFVNLAKNTTIPEMSNFS